MNGFNLRSLLFGAGAVGAVAEAINIAQKADVHITPAQWIALACTALVGFALKWPGDLTKSDAKELEARVKRESIIPPPGEEP